MELLDNLKMYLRFATGLRTYVRQRLTLDEARRIIHRRMAERETRFLNLVRRGIFEYPKSPYLSLMKLAGCEYGDISKLLRADGLKATLFKLRQAGVYVSYEELKGRIPMVRGNTTLEIPANGFDNPHLKASYLAETGGSTGPGRRIPLELDHQAAQTPQLMLARWAHGCLDSPTGLWRGPIPDGTGVAHTLRAIRYGRIPIKWFTADLNGAERPNLGYRLATQCFLNTLRILAVPVPRPEALRLEQADVVARWAAQVIEQQGSCCVLTPAGRALRVCIAAQKAGIDLTGLVFILGGEPITQAKARTIAHSGARYFPTYAMFELGLMGVGCANPRCSDDLHLVKDCYEVISNPVTLPGGDTADALNITSLMTTAPLIMLNAQIDDQAIVDEHSCGCPLEDLGYTVHLRQISSYSKLVTEGVSFVGSDVVKILEEVLPQRFGGSPLDYQLMEEEDHTGVTRVNLLVSPSVKLDDEEELKTVFLSSLKKGPASYAWARSLWNQGQTLQVHRKKPIATARGKQLTLWRQRSRQS